MPTTTSTRNWLAKPLLFLCPAALLLSSCEEPTDIGLDIQPNSQIGVYYTDDVAIEAKTVLLDSIQTTGTATQVNHLVGYLDDPVFGKVTAVTYGELRLRENAPDFGTNPKVTSVKLNLHYRSAYGITGEPMTLNVYELQQNIADDEDTTYFSFNSLRYNTGQVLGSTSIIPDSLTPKVGKRSFVSVPLEKALGTRILNLPSSNLANQASFRDAFKGIAITPGTNVGRSIVNFGFDRDIDSSFVEIFYTNDEETDTTSFKLYLDKSSNRFHSIKGKRLGTPLNPLAANGDTLDPVAINTALGETFIQSGVGLRTIYRFPNLQNLRDQLGGEISINRAELVMPVVGGSTSLFAPPPVLVMAEARGSRLYYTNTASLSPLFVGTDSNPLTFQPVAYDSDLNQYKAQLGTYLQSVLYGRKQNRGIVVYPASNAVQVGRVRLAKPGPEGTRLRIYYTKIG